MPTVLLSCAVTLDGYLNDRSGERLMLSSPEDRDVVDALRAAADAVVVGHGTMVADDPLLTVRSAVRQTAREIAGRPRQPLRVALAGRHVLPADARLLTDGAAPTLVYGAEPVAGENVEHVPYRGRGIRPVLLDLRRRGVERVLIEGGEGVSSDVIRNELADILRLAVAPALVGRSGAPRIGGRLRGGVARWLPMQPAATEIVGTTSVLTFAKAGQRLLRFDPRSDAEWLAEAIELGRRCPPSERAYSVGAWIVGPDGIPVAFGFSRETDPSVHAEESAIRKARQAGATLNRATLYTSMEPCSRRLSGRPSCCRHIVEAGIARVVFAQREPPTFVQCEGVEFLRAQGVEVVEIAGLAGHAAELNRHLEGA